MSIFYSWDQELDRKDSLYALNAIAEILADETTRQRYPDFPWGDAVAMLDYNFDYKSMDVAGAKLLRQVQALYRKYEPLEIPGAPSKEEVAVAKFLDSEAKCRETNLIFDARFRGRLFFRPEVEEVLYRAQLKIRDILGEVPKLSQLKLRYGPGGTTNVQKKNASVTNKLGAELACSEPLVPYLSEVLHELPSLCDFEGDQGSVTVEIHHGKLTFVPKDAKQYRSVVTEPVLSGMCQLGIGDYMANLLRGAGLDIRDQAANQKLALRGSLTGDLATLDLSSASDLVSKELVAFLLPTEWWAFLKRFRSNSVSYDTKLFDVTIQLEKFSSMGNGYTFALETLIFYALAWASCPRGSTVRAYGDDIIVPTDNVDLVIEVLETCGFSVNHEKSFWEGPFRESCGADYLSGFNIRPYFFTDYVSCESIFSFHNFLVRAGMQSEADAVRDLFLDKNLQIWGPDGVGDGHLIGSWAAAPYKRQLGWAGFTYETFKWNDRKDSRTGRGYPAFPAYSIYVRDPSFGEDLSDVLYDEEFTLRRIPWRRKTSYLRMLCRKLDNVVNSGLPVLRQNPRASLPGTRGFKRIRIYTLVVPDYIIS